MGHHGGGPISYGDLEAQRVLTRGPAMTNPDNTFAATPFRTTPTSKLAVLPRQSAIVKKHRASTLCAYARDVLKFQAYGFSVPCAAADLLAFLRTQTGRVSPATALRRVMAIQHEHRRLGHASPTGDPRVREAMRVLAAGQMPQLDAKNGKRAAQPQPMPEKARKPAKSVVSRAALLRMFDAMGTQRRAMDLRDKALMLLAFAGLKRAVALSLAIEHLRFTDDALLLTIPSDPADAADGPPPPRPRPLAIPRTRGPLCPVTATEVWLAHLDRLDQTGPVFCKFDRGGDPVAGSQLDAAYLNCIIKKRARDAGFSEAEIAGFSTESLRRGGAMERVRR